MRILAKLLTWLKQQGGYAGRMRPTLAHAREAAIVAGASLMAIAAARAAIDLLGHASPFVPGTVSGIVMALLIFLLRRYGPRGAVEPRRRRTWLVVGICGGMAVAACGLIACLWIERTYAVPNGDCPARSWSNSASLAEAANTRVPCRT
jgi:hypothetical protein